MLVGVAVRVAVGVAVSVKVAVTVNVLVDVGVPQLTFSVTVFDSSAKGGFDERTMATLRTGLAPRQFASAVQVKEPWPPYSTPPKAP